jgi:hypothetical protein
MQVFLMGIGETPVDPCPVAPCEPIVASSSPFSWFDSIFRPQGIVAVPTDPCAPDTCPTAPPVFDLMSFRVRSTDETTICAGPQPPKIWCEKGKKYDDPEVAKLCGKNDIAWVRSRTIESNFDTRSEAVKAGPYPFEVTLSGNSSIDGALQAFIAKYFVGVDIHATGDGSISGTFKGQICWDGMKYTTRFDRVIVYTIHYTGGYEETTRRVDHPMKIVYGPMTARAC